jgi:hypothetical protein
MDRNPLPHRARLGCTGMDEPGEHVLAGRLRAALERRHELDAQLLPEQRALVVAAVVALMPNTQWNTLAIDMLVRIEYANTLAVTCQEITDPETLEIATGLCHGGWVGTFAELLDAAGALTGR